MRKIKCELCVQRDLLKEGSRFVCQTCGAAYSADQLRRQFDLADQAEIYAEAKQAYRAKRFKQARQLYLVLAEEGGTSRRPFTPAFPAASSTRRRTLPPF